MNRTSINQSVSLSTEDINDIINDYNNQNNINSSSTTSTQEEQGTMDTTDIEVDASIDSTQCVEEVQNTIIPPNPIIADIDDTTNRFSGALWFKTIQEKTIILAGIGGIGSYVAFLLARMKPTSLFIYDDDIVEAHNMSGQLYRMEDINTSKVSSMANTLKSYADYYHTFAVQERYTADHEATDIMICGFDNMAARKVFFNNWLKHVESLPITKRKNCLFIDGRLAAEEFQIFCIQGDDSYNIERYKSKYLFSDAEADETLCSYKQTTFCANMIGSYMVNLFVNFCANQCNPLIERDLPFYTYYSAERIFLKTEG